VVVANGLRPPRKINPHGAHFLVDRCAWRGYGVFIEQGETQMTQAETADAAIQGWFKAMLTEHIVDLVCTATLLPASNSHAAVVKAYGTAELRNRGAIS